MVLHRRCALTANAACHTPVGRGAHRGVQRAAAAAASAEGAGAAVRQGQGAVQRRARLQTAQQHRGRRGCTGGDTSWGRGAGAGDGQPIKTQESRNRRD